MATFNISSYEDLKDASDPLEGHMNDDLVLLNDIDCIDSFEENPEYDLVIPTLILYYHGFKPIGEQSSTYVFTGTFDGGGFTISNLHIDGSDGWVPFIGMFGFCDPSWLVADKAGSWKDVTLLDADIVTDTGGACILIAYEQNSGAGVENVFSNIHAKGVLTANGAGGLAGMVTNTSGTWNDCTTDVNIVGQGSGAGFVTGVNTSVFNRCHSTGSITIDGVVANMAVGGFVGNVNNNGGAFYDCTATVAIAITNLIVKNAIWGAGGFVGSTRNGLFSRCYAGGVIIANVYGWVQIGGFQGYWIDGGVFSECGANVDIECPNVGGDYGASSYIGGFAGVASANYTDCYARGDVCASGITNNHEAGREAYIGGFHGGGRGINCYSIGYIGRDIPGTGPTINRGGFTGLSSVAGTACYFDTQTSGMSVGNGGGTQVGFTGKTTSQMKTELTFQPSGTDPGEWDFINTWIIPEYVLSGRLQSNLTLWLSRSGEYDNFEEGVDENDAFSLTLPTTNEIRWIKGLESLVIGTSESEWKLASNKLDTPLSPQAYSAKEQTTHGSAPIAALAVNASLLFVDYVRRKVREVTYQVTEEKYVSPDMTELAEHITESGIVCMAHQKNPDSIVWAVRADGTLISMVYDREQDVVAWSRHETDGNVQSVCVIPNPDAIEDDVWISVDREGIVCIEKMMPRNFGPTLANAFFVDSGVTSTSGSAVVTGLSHLIGKELVVMGDGVELEEATPGDFTVSALGTIRVPAGLSIVHAGLPFEYQLKPMRIVLGSPQGTSYGSTTRVSEVVLSFLNTLDVSYGNNADDQYAIDFTDPRWEDEEYIDGLFSGDVVVAMPGGFSINNPILISGSGVYPFTLRAMIVRLDKTGR